MSPFLLFDFRIFDDIVVSVRSLIVSEERLI